jgi:hypothetical protein
MESKKAIVSGWKAYMSKKLTNTETLAVGKNSRRCTQEVEVN